MTALKGTAVSPGYASGTLVVYEPPRLEAVERRSVEAQQIEEEMARFDAAVDRAVDEVSLVRSQVAIDVGEGEASIFDAHCAMLRDTSLRKNIHERLLQELLCVEAVLADEMQAFAKRLAASGSDYLKELSLDAFDVGNRLLRC